MFVSTESISYITIKLLRNYNIRYFFKSVMSMDLKFFLKHFINFEFFLNRILLMDFKWILNFKWIWNFFFGFTL